MIADDRRVRIITGHYGSGKTEFAVNYAVKLAQQGKTAVLADIDIINPYFRSRERAGMLESLGVRLIAGSVDAPGLDLPALSADVYSFFDNKLVDAVVDAGGDAKGAAVLKRFSDRFDSPGDYDLLLVINANRPETRTAAQVLGYIASIEKASSLKVSGLINNTHMLKSTSVGDIIKGYRLSQEAAAESGVPLRYNAGLEGLFEELPDEIRQRYFPLELYMREEWMS